MSGQWAKDPHGRAELRYWDGTTWTDHVSNGGVQSVEAGGPGMAFAAQQHPTTLLPRPASSPYPTTAVPSKGTSGRLIAAGVMTIVEAALALIFGLWMFSLTTSEIGGFADDLTGGALTFAALLITAIGVALLWSGIGSCKGRNWARITIIVLHAIAAVLIVVGAIGSATESDRNEFSTEQESNPVAGLVVLGGWTGAIIFLAASGKPNHAQIAPAGYSSAPAGFGPPQDR